MYQQIIYPKKPLYEFIVNNIYLIKRKEYEIKKVNVVLNPIKKLNVVLDPTKLHFSLDIKHFDANPETDYFEKECVFNGKKCRFISSKSNDNILNIPLDKSVRIRDASPILYAELLDEYNFITEDVTERVREYYRGTNILDSVLDDFDDDYVTINCPSLLEKLFTIPRKNSHHSLKIMKL